MKIMTRQGGEWVSTPVKIEGPTPISPLARAAQDRWANMEQRRQQLFDRISDEKMKASLAEN